MGGKKSVFSEFCKSLGVGISAVLIVAAVVGVVALKLDSNWSSHRVTRLTQKPATGHSNSKHVVPLRHAKTESHSKDRDADLSEPADKARPPKTKPKAKQTPNQVVRSADHDSPKTAAVAPRATALILSNLKGIASKKSVDGDRKRAELIGELYRADPTHRLLAALMEERWLTLQNDPNVREERNAARSSESTANGNGT